MELQCIFCNFENCDNLFCTFSIQIQIKNFTLRGSEFADPIQEKLEIVWIYFLFSGICKSSNFHLSRLIFAVGLLQLTLQTFLPALCFQFLTM